MGFQGIPQGIPTWTLSTWGAPQELNWWDPVEHWTSPCGKLGEEMPGIIQSLGATIIVNWHKLRISRYSSCFNWQNQNANDLHLPSWAPTLALRYLHAPRCGEPFIGCAVATRALSETWHLQKALRSIGYGVAKCWVAIPQQLSTIGTLESMRTNTLAHKDQKWWFTMFVKHDTEILNSMIPFICIYEYDIPCLTGGGQGPPLVYFMDIKSGYYQSRKHYTGKDLIYYLYPKLNQW